MRIHSARVVEEERSVRLEARVEGSATALPEHLWFELERGQVNPPHLVRFEPFVTALVPVAMALGEDLEVEGSLSPQLADGLRSWQRAVSQWWPEQFQEINVRAQVLEAAGVDPAPGMGSCFSGGVDAYFSLWSHLPSQEPIATRRISHALLIHGFDKDVDPEVFARMHAVYEPVLREWGVSPLILRTNLRTFRVAAMSPRQLVNSYGSFLAACAHALVDTLGRMQIAGAASYRHADLFPNGSHAVLDHLLGCERLQIIHDGTQATRAEKVSTLAGVPETRHTLRVCETPPTFPPAGAGLLNCCRCVKCRRTMISLDLHGVLEEYSAFPEPLRREQIRQLYAPGVEGSIFLQDNLEMARRLGRKDRIRDLTLAVWWNRLVAPIRRLRASV